MVLFQFETNLPFEIFFHFQKIDLLGQIPQQRFEPFLRVFCLQKLLFVFQRQRENGRDEVCETINVGSVLKRLQGFWRQLFCHVKILLSIFFYLAD